MNRISEGEIGKPSAERADQPQASQAVNRVTLDQLAEKTAPSGSAKTLHPLAMIGTYLACGVLVAMVVATGVVLWLAFSGPTPTFPQMPSGPNVTPENVARYQDLAQVYEQFLTARTDRALRLFQGIVMTALVPSFAAILGYIFGTHKGD